MTGAPAGLRRVLDDLGTTLLDLLHGDPDAVPRLGGVAIHDPIDEPELPPAALVLGVGVGGAAATITLLTQLGRRGAAGLVLRAPVTVTPAVLAAARESGVALLGLTRGATWAQLAAMLRVLLAEGDVGAQTAESLGGLPSGDLFALANAVAALVDAPITIEDRSNRVLAFSGRQDEADPGRIQTVLGLQVPEVYSRVLTERGVFRELYRSTGPVLVEPVTPLDGAGALPRAAIAVRAGDEVLGSIWAVLRDGLSPDRARALGEAATLVALHMLRVRAGADVQRRLQADLVSTALEGGAGAREALHRLGLADRSVVVLALAALDPAAGVDAASDAGSANDRQRLADAFGVHLSAVHPRSATALVGHAVYGLVPVTGEDADARAVRIATDFLDRIGPRIPAVVGIGPAGRDVAGLAAARVAADRALRVLRVRAGAAGGGAVRVARADDVHVEGLLLELHDLAEARGDRPAGPVARLGEYDAAHGAQLVPTLRAWLDAFGDVPAAAAALYVHPNTFRYRLRRVAEVGGIDLGDPDVRFAAMVQLRLLDR
ncbi:DNA-binding transcriptional regulator, PucR family [Klenkia soli]|uniref:DNA-binding transcriptional regulator, PucR family n=1 Tax=Klenkia soli TaxID=1052260 RepID=A0A1H0SI01_9ACTN|nr:PucR family transcriptional regulator [Klenkia soli]SDP41347.1 DNA-binding transcriptional regulator, PucR family [Klenkia soli]